MLTDKVVEAVDEYEKLNKGIMKVLTSGEQALKEDQQKFLNKLAIVCGIRAKAAQDLSGEFDGDLTVEQMKLLLPALKELCTSQTVPAFPIDTASLRRQLTQLGYTATYEQHRYRLTLVG